MEPGREDREHQDATAEDLGPIFASMEPGREDREHTEVGDPLKMYANSPQWNPAVKTGSTKFRSKKVVTTMSASMEPGREDREHPAAVRSVGQFPCRRLNGTRP